MVMKKLLVWLLDRADEPSTWRGLFILGSALGFITLPAEQAALIAAGLAMVFGSVDIATPEPKRKIRKNARLDDIDYDEFDDDELLHPDDDLRSYAEAYNDEAARRRESAAAKGRRAFGID
jgi:hypothetical protein